MTYTVQYKFGISKSEEWHNGVTVNSYMEAKEELRHIKKQVNGRESKHRIVDQNGKRVK